MLTHKSKFNSTTKWRTTGREFLSDIKDWLHVQLNRGNLVECPACGQKAKIYSRPLTSKMGVALILLSKGTRVGEDVHVPTFIAEAIKNLPAKTRAGFQGGDVAKLRHYGLIEEINAPVKGGAKKAGYYRVTKLGRQFSTGKAKVKKRHKIYNEKLLRLEGPEIYIKEVLPEDFSFKDLMSR